MYRMLIVAVAASALTFSAGCATKKYVRNQTAPLATKANELDELTAQNTRNIKDVDARAQQGIQDVNQRAAAAAQKAGDAQQQANAAQQLASQASNRVTSLHNTIVNLDNYRPVVETAVHFGFDKSDLTRKAKDALDQMGAEIPNAKNWIVVINGNTDSVGSEAYNYELSQRRADAVIQYLASKYNVPAYRIYLIGLGKDKPAVSNKSAKGRAENRRVDVRLMTNVAEGNQSAAQAQPPQQ